MGLFIGFSMTMEPSSYGDTPTMASACPAWAARIKGDQPCASTWTVGFGAWGVDGMLNGEMLDDFRDMLGIFQGYFRDMLGIFQGYFRDILGIF